MARHGTHEAPGLQTDRSAGPSSGACDGPPGRRAGGTDRHAAKDLAPTKAGAGVPRAALLSALRHVCGEGPWLEPHTPQACLPGEEVYEPEASLLAPPREMRVQWSRTTLHQESPSELACAGVPGTP